MEEKLLNISGSGTKKSPYVFKITGKAREFFYDIEGIEKTIKELESNYTSFKCYIESIENRQLRNRFKFKTRDLKFVQGLKLNSWYSLTDIRNEVGCSRGHATTVMPWLVRKGFAIKEKVMIRCGIR